MAGHNEWSKVKRHQGAPDANRDRQIPMLAIETSLAARTGGMSPAGSLRLRRLAERSKRPAENLAAIAGSVCASLSSQLSMRGAEIFYFQQNSTRSVSNAPTVRQQLRNIGLETGSDRRAADDEDDLITASHSQLSAVGDSLHRAGLEPDSTKLTYLPDDAAPRVDETAAAQFLRFSEALEDHDEVQSFRANADPAESRLVTIGG
jgi:transcriptional/translational regulatory protein YebC/TACO1